MALVEVKAKKFETDKRPEADGLHSAGISFQFHQGFDCYHLYDCLSMRQPSYRCLVAFNRYFSAVCVLFICLLCPFRQDMISVRYFGGVACSAYALHDRLRKLLRHLTVSFAPLTTICSLTYFLASLGCK